MKRQKFRRALLLISFLLFPVTIWYFSPYLIIQAASEHIMNGSFIVFCTMFLGFLCKSYLKEANMEDVHKEYEFINSNVIEPVAGKGKGKYIFHWEV